jgi:hypothetical protein
MEKRTVRSDLSTIIFSMNISFRNGKMKFSEVVRKILHSNGTPMTPQEIRDFIKINYPKFYGTPGHIRNVDHGHYKDIDHALLAQIYTIAGKNNGFLCDKGYKPMKISLVETQYHTIHVPQPLRKTTRASEMIHYAKNVRDILANTEKYHRAYYDAETFRGPSIYFHHRALETRNKPTGSAHLEYVYATLSAWGMHRMGKGGSKMQPFDIFRQSIERFRDRITEAQGFSFQEMSGQKWSVLKEIFQGINVMASGTSIVGNSKVMHHMLPNIVPPIDREYTLWYLRGNTNIKNDLPFEWQLMKGIISEFFIPVASDKEFIDKITKWMERKDQYPWDTSIFKVIDNLIIGSKKAANES